MLNHPFHLTSLNEIMGYRPCKAGWHAILEGQKNKVTSYDDLFSLEEALESNGIDDVLWFLGARQEGGTEIIRVFAVYCADSIEYRFESKYKANIEAQDANRRTGVGAALSASRAADIAAVGTYDYYTTRDQQKQHLWKLIKEFSERQQATTKE